MNYRRIKASIQRMMDENYPDFIQALISIETGGEEALVYDLEEPDRATDLFSADELA